MPYVSDRQRRYFNAAAARGEMKQSTVNEFNKSSKGMNLPEKVKKAYGGQIHVIEHDSPEGDDYFRGDTENYHGPEYMLDGMGHEKEREEELVPEDEYYSGGMTYSVGGPVNENSQMPMRFPMRPMRYAKGGKISIIHMLGSKLK